MSDVPAHGVLKPATIPELLWRLYQNQETGILHVNSRLGRYELFLRQGYPVASTIPGNVELIGKVAKEMGIIDVETYRKIQSELPPAGVLYGDWLADKGLMTAEQLKLALKAQTRRRLHRFFFIADGDFRYQSGPHDRDLKGGLRIHPARSIYHGVLSAWDVPRLDRAMPALLPQVFRCTLEDAHFARYGFGENDRRVVDALRQADYNLLSLEQTFALPPQPVRALIFALYVTGGLNVHPMGDLSEVVVEGTPQAPPSPASQTESSQSAPQQVVSASSSPPSGSQVKQAATSTSSVSQVRPAVSTAAAVELKKEIEAKSKVVETETLFAVLGVSAEATKDQIKQAYFEAAKRFHPDRLKTLGLETMRSEVEKIFRRVSEAHTTLADDARREEYKKTMATPKSAAEVEAHQQAMKALAAEKSFKRGQVFLRNSDLANALKEFEIAVENQPKEGEYLAHLIWAKLGTNQMPSAEAKNKLLEITKTSPRCARVYYFLGMCTKADSEPEKALPLFRKALDLDERLLDAEREIRLLQIRKDKGKTGIFSSLNKPIGGGKEGAKK